MNVNEKILLVQLLLVDIRYNWGDGLFGKNEEDRALKAKSLCEEIAIELHDSNYLILAERCDAYIKESRECGDWDGRYFRHIFPYGYQDMDKLHGLDPVYMATEFITCPEFIFENLEESRK